MTRSIGTCWCTGAASIGRRSTLGTISTQCSIWSSGPTATGEARGARITTSGRNPTGWEAGEPHFGRADRRSGFGLHVHRRLALVPFDVAELPAQRDELRSHGADHMTTTRVRVG